ncbi:MAG: 3-oxoacyl-ACP reductase [Gammaproteobacteria bacterium]|nr:3-oxoacyl-ACP reductase [Gammaproteobacteria bacterium]MBT8151810.1 3-oxoacyl-ACP reductase [Gammaproteobacteria bacterium]NND39378.1 3-oxoacyl-ACP reductase [Pseudomonadales bacterium]NNM10525.1 3-oxoacyl-ACP reductase [Pseudomonadales bacterium]RZV59992.1 MAG: 3-oxoacyl-ACP reductase [Pseudomonadales bacterium]
MSDRYVDFVNSGVGQSLARSVGLPQPVKLRRYEHGIDFIDGDCLVGAAPGAEHLDALAKVLASSRSSIYVKCDNPEVKGLLQVDGLAARDYDVVMPDKIRALVFDASGITNSTQLRELYNFFHPVARKLQSCSRVLVIGRPPENADTPEHRIAQRALEGFTRALGKELGKGTTVQLCYAVKGAGDGIASTVRFVLSSRSAYVSGQVIRVGKAKLAAKFDWDEPLAGKVALVTGAARGIGESIAEVLAREGAHVVCLDIPPAEDDLKKVADRIGGSYITADITHADTPQTLVDYFGSEHKGLDILVHNAGVTRDKTLGKMKPEFWDMVLDINLSSEERVNKALLEAETLKSGAHIICVSSMAGIAGTRGQTNYACSKAGVIGMVDAMAPILKKQKITINAVAPGFIETAMTAAMPFGPREVGRRLNSMSQGGLPVDVAETICWFASPASAGVTGNVVRVCGQSLLGA